MQRYFTHVYSIAEKIKKLEPKEQVKKIGLLENQITLYFNELINFERFQKDYNLKLIESLIAFTDFIQTSPGIQTSPRLEKLNNRIHLLVYALNNQNSQNVKFNLEIIKHVIKNIVPDLEEILYHKNLQNKRLEQFVKLLLVVLSALIQLSGNDFAYFSSAGKRLPGLSDLPSMVIRETKKRRQSQGKEDYRINTIT